MLRLTNSIDQTVFSSLPPGLSQLSNKFNSNIPLTSVKENNSFETLDPQVVGDSHPQILKLGLKIKYFEQA